MDLKKFMYIIMFTLFVSCLLPTFVNAQSEKDEILLSTLYPKINEQIENEFGVMKKYDCVKVISIKKKYKNALVFEAKVNVIVYEGNKKPPYHLLSFTFSNEEGTWGLVSFENKKLPNNFSLNSCENNN